MAMTSTEGPSEQKPVRGLRPVHQAIESFFQGKKSMPDVCKFIAASTLVKRTEAAISSYAELLGILPEGLPVFRSQYEAMVQLAEDYLVQGEGLAIEGIRALKVCDHVSFLALSQRKGVNENAHMQWDLVMLTAHEFLVLYATAPRVEMLNALQTSGTCHPVLVCGLLALVNYDTRAMQHLDKIVKKSQGTDGGAAAGEAWRSVFNVALSRLQAISDASLHDPRALALVKWLDEHGVKQSGGEQKRRQVFMFTQAQFDALPDAEKPKEVCILHPPGNGDDLRDRFINLSELPPSSAPSSGAEEGGQ